MLLLCFVLGVLAALSLNARSYWNRWHGIFPLPQNVRVALLPHVAPLLDCEVTNPRVLAAFEPMRARVSSLKERLVRDQKARKISVYFRTMQRGRWFGIDENTRYSTASLIKTPLAIAILKQAEVHPELLDQRLTYEGDFDFTGDQNIKPSQHIEKGKSYTIRELLERMIVFSGNNSKELLRRHFDPSVFVSVFNDLPISLSHDELKGAQISAKDLSYFFRILYNATYLSPNLSEMALSILTRVEYKNALSAGIPPGIEVAHKFAERKVVDAQGNTLSVELHDCGIVFHPTHPYFLCVMTEGNDFGSLETSIKEISATVYEAVQNEFKVTALGR